MGLIGRLFSRRRVPIERQPEPLRARFDVAQTTDGNRNHWTWSDHKSADHAMSHDVRKVLRERSRYESANNSYAAGILRTIADDTVGVAPRVQIRAGSDEAVVAAVSSLEAAWNRWSSAIDLGGKLRTMRMAKARDGECFALLINNPKIRDNTGVSLDLSLIECDQVQEPYIPNLREGEKYHIDGVILDDAGNVVAYNILDLHPGAELGQGFQNYRRFPASQVIHYFRPERPGQHRGVPELTAALPLFAQLRRYTLAVLSSAEAAASFSGIIYTDAPPGGEARPLRALEPVALERQTLLTMPAGWRMSQLAAEQPTSTYADFKGELLDEIGRCLCVPSNVIRGNSSSYNYASGRLDFQIYRRAIEVERGVLERVVLDRIYKAWFDEAVLASDVIPPRLRSAALSHKWMWSSAPHVDPMKEAAAAEIRLRSGLTTIADEYAAAGKDWQEQMQQRAAEINLAESLGISAYVEDEDEDETIGEEESDE